MTTSLSPTQVEAAARAISAADDVSINWDDLSEQSRVDYTRMAYAALNTAVPDLRQAISRVRDLHQPEKRWGNEDYSLLEDEYVAWPEDYPGLAPFTVCAHCSTIEREATGNDDGLIGFRSTWPCPTIKALNGDNR